MAEIVVQVLEKSAVVALAVFAIWMLQQSYKGQLEAEKRWAKQREEWAQQERQDKLLLTDVLREVSAQMATSCAVLRNLAEKVGVNVEVKAG